MAKWSIEKFELPLKYSWSISGGSRTTLEGFLIILDFKNYTGIGEVSFSTKNRNSLEVEQEFIRFSNEFTFDCANISRNLDSLDSLLLPMNLRSAIESAIVEVLVKKGETDGLPSFLSSKAKGLSSSFSIPILNTDETIDFYYKYNLERFERLKLKVSKDNLSAILRVINEASLIKSVSLDFNECFERFDEARAFLGELDPGIVKFVEQPFKVSDEENYRKLKAEKLLIPIFADESIGSELVTEKHFELFDGVVIKLFKSGGLLNACKQLQAAKALGLKTLLGCMVETSIGISKALEIAPYADFLDLDGFLFSEKDPFERVVEKYGKLFLNG